MLETFTFKTIHCISWAFGWSVSDGLTTFIPLLNLSSLPCHKAIHIVLIQDLKDKV